MSSSHAPRSSNSPSEARRAPQVVVRAGKTYLCSACGTLVQVPDDVVGRLVIAVDPAPQDPPEEDCLQVDSPEESSQPEQANDQATDQARPSIARPAAIIAAEHVPDPACREAKTSAVLVSPKQRPSRPRRPRPPRRELFTGEIIDGLRVPTADEFDRAQAWIAFHLKVLDRQGSELRRLQKLLKSRSNDPVPSRCSQRHGPRAAAVAGDLPAEDGPRNQAGQGGGAPSPTHAQADWGVAPSADNEHPRGPP